MWLRSGDREGDGDPHYLVILPPHLQLMTVPPCLSETDVTVNPSVMLSTALSSLLT